MKIADRLSPLEYRDWIRARAMDVLSNLVLRARQGERITLIDKIRDEEDIDVLDGMRAACGARGRVLTDEEIWAFQERRFHLMKRNKAHAK